MMERVYDNVVIEEEDHAQEYDVWNLSILGFNFPK